MDRGFSSTSCLLVILWCIMGSVSGMSDAQELGLIIGCSVGGVVLLVVAIILLVVCCRSSKKEKERTKKKKGDYLQFHEASTLQSQFHTKPSLKEPPKANGYLNGHIHSNGYVNNKYHSNGNLPPPKLGRSRSDVLDQRRRVKPEWRRQQEVRDGKSHANLNGRLSGGSDSAVPGPGIWTSNPSMTQGMMPSTVMLNPGNNGTSQNSLSYSSAPTLQITTLDPSLLDNSRHGPRHHQQRRELHDVQEDKKELLAVSSSDETNSTERERALVARAFSNPGFLAEQQELTLKRPSIKDGHFIAKVYSDYQLPKDFIPPSKINDGKVAKAYSGHTLEHAKKSSSKESTPDKTRRELTPDIRCSKQSVTDGKQSSPDIHKSQETIQSGSSGHIARVTVRQTSSLDSSGEPKYAKPQDAISSEQQPQAMSRSDWILYSNKTSSATSKSSHPVTRAHSSKEKTKRHYVQKESNAKKAHRNSKHIVANEGSASAQISSSAMELREPMRKSSDGLYLKHYMERPSTSSDSSKHSNNVKMRHDAKSKKQNRINKMEKAKKSESFNIFIAPREEVATKRSSAPVDMPVSTETVGVHKPPSRPQLTLDITSARDDLNVTSSPEPKSEHTDSPEDTIRPISESSSTEDISANIKTRTTAKPTTIIPDESCAIYSTPIPRESRIDSNVIEDNVNIPETPMSPAPPPLPPITRLREEPPTPTSPRPTPEAGNKKHNDGDQISTGKCVIGDAFQFLEDYYDHISIDGADRL